MGTKIEFKEWQKKSTVCDWKKQEGLFLAWGIDTDENCGSFSAAIILMEDKSLRLVSVQNIIRFDY